MLKKDFYWLVACAVLGAASMRIAAAQAPPAPAAPAPPLPVFAPSLVPALFVDLMTAEGMAASGFDDSSWPTIDPKGLADRRGGGKVSFLWFRTNLTIPAQIGKFDTAGAMAVLTAYVDDCAEVWINGQMPRRAGIPSPATIQGFNMPNRVVLTDSVKAGDKFQIAIFGINGPISVVPPNFVFFREAKIEFYK